MFSASKPSSERLADFAFPSLYGMPALIRRALAGSVRARRRGYSGKGIGCLLGQHSPSVFLHDGRGKPVFRSHFTSPSNLQAFQAPSFCKLAKPILTAVKSPPLGSPKRQVDLATHAQRSCAAAGCPELAPRQDAALNDADELKGDGLGGVEFGERERAMAGFFSNVGEGEW